MDRAEIARLQAALAKDRAALVTNTARLARVPKGYRQPLVEMVQGAILGRIMRDQVARDALLAEEVA